MIKRRRTASSAFNQKELQSEIEAEAQAIGIPVGTAHLIAGEVADKIGAWATKKSMVTNDDLNRKVAAELERYNKDLAYVYKNRGKII